MKLNLKRTTIIGFAFFAILMLWQVYNTYCPLFLTDLLIANYGGAPADYSYIIGIIMAMDNILALFMLPLFGDLSDKTKSPLGKRMPYIILGTFLAVVLFPLIAITFINGKLIWLAIIMGLVLVAMNIYRSPAVALMPDITPKPLRSKGNAIINLVGYLGAITAGALAMIFKVSAGESGRIVNASNFTILAPFIITAVLMVVALIILIINIKENKLHEELKEEMELGEKMAETSEAIIEDKPLSKVDKSNLWVLLISIFLWFFAFNAIETFGSSFGTYYLGESSGWWGTGVIIMTVCSIIAFIPAGWISSKLGRKNSVMLGLGLMLLGMIIAIFIGKGIPLLYYPCIAIAGIGWAWINVNSYPMVVELANKENIGKFTGWYYTASMLAQSITPICVGLLFNILGYNFLFIYSAIFTFVALMVFMLYKTTKQNLVKAELGNDKGEKTLEKTEEKNEEELAEVKVSKPMTIKKPTATKSTKKTARKTSGAKKTSSSKASTSKAVANKPSQKADLEKPAELKKPTAKKVQNSSKTKVASKKNALEKPKTEIKPPVKRKTTK